MNVALLGITGNFTQNSGAGIQRYMFELYNHLKNSYMNIDKIEFRPIPLIGSGMSFALHTIFENFNKYDILHNLMPVPFLKPKLFRESILITTAHDFQPLLYPQFTFDHGTTLKDKFWLKLVVKPGFKSTLNSDYLIVISSQTKEEAIELGFDKTRIFIASLGLDGRFTNAKVENHVKIKSFKVGYMGALRLRKNIKFAIEAANQINDKKIEFEFWGKKEYEYKYLISQTKNNNIKFMSFAPEDKLVQIYDSFDAFVFPSFHEGEGLPILESQARGLPVIIYKYGKIPKEVRKYCFEAESPEHMAQIIEHIKENGYNEKQRKKATEYARSFTWEKCAKETLEVYKKLK